MPAAAHASTVRSTASIGSASTAQSTISGNASTVGTHGMPCSSDALGFTP
ncbi:MAG: hypothetical protein WDN04_20015 [Rhodospirillales bacterium]